MLWASIPSSDSRRRRVSQRSATLTVVIALHLLLMLALMRLASPAARPPEFDRNPVTFELLPDAPRAPMPTRTAAKPARASGGTAPKTPAPKTAPVPAKPPAQPVTQAPSAIWQQVLPLTREELAAADVSKMPSRSGEGNGAASGDSSGKGNGPTEAAGGAPGSERLYDADWFRRPTHAELAFYLPSGRDASGWGAIACQTMPDNRVENCREIGQSPGSGLASAVRQAAWQFRIRAPRIGGRPIIGAWVTIRIDYIRGVGVER
jgi:protein TonB